MCPAWLLVAVAVVGVVRGAVSQCWEHPSCQDVKSEGSMMECIQLCRSDLTAETPVIPGDIHEKKDGGYKMKHFRWGGPPASKRYGGFMKSWDERSQRPLLTLFKNVINKDGQQNH
uniref:Proopiomelanocortin n=1 Tax=Epinephelus malabaricus TaxID=162300 RepID=A0A915VF35_EPIML|nr:proopiomelanocortin [Epinephelus malabaricus]